MAIYTGANQRLIRPGSQDPPIIVIGAILHVDAGNSASLYNYFNGPSNGIESHFHFPKVGRPEQYRDTGYEADANLKANSFTKDGRRYGYLSAETQGYERGEWNDHQLVELKKWLLWASKTHNFPLRRCPAHTQPGVGYHVMFGAPGPWSPVSKSCPGPDRIKQFNNVLVPWFANPTTPEKETDMDAADKARLERIEKKLDGFVFTEAGRYKVDADRYGEFHDTLARLERIEKKLDGFVFTEAGRYKVDTDRYGEFHATLARIMDELADDPTSPVQRA